MATSQQLTWATWHNFFLLLQIGRRLWTGYAHPVNVEIPRDGTLFHLFRSAKHACDANPSILKRKIKGGSEHICNSVWQCLWKYFCCRSGRAACPSNALWDKMKLQTALWVASRNPTRCNTELYKWWKAGHDEGRLLADLPQPWQLKDQTITRC